MTKKEIIKYLQENKMDIQNANAAFFAADMVFGAYANSEKKTGVDFSPVFSYFSYKNTKRGFASFLQIIPDKLIENAGKKTYSDYLKDPKTLLAKRKQHRKLEKDLDNLWEIYLENKEKVLKNPYSFYKNFLDISSRWWYLGSCEEGKGRSIEAGPVLNYSRRNSVSLEKSVQIISKLSHPREASIFTLERKYFFDICLFVLGKKEKDASFLIQDKILKQKLDHYIKNYFWFKTDFYRANIITRESLLQDALKEIKNRTKEDILSEAGRAQDDFKKIEKKKEELRLKVKIKKLDERDINFATNIILWIDERKRGMMKQLYYLYNFLEDFAPKNNLDYHYLILYSTKEFGNFLKNGKKLNKKIIEARDKELFTVSEKNKDIKMFYGKDAEELFLTATRVKNQELIGKVANRGGEDKIIGRARIVLNPTKDLFLEGEILITSMTRVEFMPLMRRAKAIITNEGGIACHAAIISRELGVPCIIGTKIATQVLKDGDLVEVDANKGIVKILKQ